MRSQLGIFAGAVTLLLVNCSSSSDGSGSSAATGGAPSSAGGASGSPGASGAHANGGTSGSSSGGSSNPSGGAGGRASSNGGTAGITASGGTASAGTTSTGGAGGVSAGTLPVIGGCSIFTADDAWNTPVTNEAVDTAWTAKIQALVGAVNIHPDYGTPPIGIPINVVTASQTKVTVGFDEPDESDPGPYAFPDPGVALIEGGTPENCDGDCHVLSIQQGSCLLYEGDSCGYSAGNGWQCYSGAIFDLKKNSYGQRTKGFTSADAAGLSITAGLVRHDEAAAGAIHHAIRFTVPCTLNKYVKPASHEAVPTKPPGCAANANAVPMGIRVRLDPGVTVKNASPAALAVVTAMQTYGMILADNGSSFYFQGEVSADWADADTEPLKSIPASAFKVVQVPPLEP
jgi:hypothetical protein